MSTIMSPWCLKVWTSINHKVTRTIVRLVPFDLETIAVIAHDWQTTIKNEKEYKNLSGLLIKNCTRLLLGLANTQRIFSWRKIAEN